MKEQKTIAAIDREFKQASMENRQELYIRYAADERDGVRKLISKYQKQELRLLPPRFVRRVQPSASSWSFYGLPFHSYNDPLFPGSCFTTPLNLPVYRP